MLPNQGYEPACLLCEDRGWVRIRDSGVGSVRPCSCRDESRVNRLLEAAGIPERYRNCRLDNFRVDLPGSRTQLGQAHNVARKYVDSFLTESGKFLQTGLLFVGPPGAGKTHLAAAVLSELIRFYKVRGRFVDFTTLVHQIQSTFDPRSPESKREILDPVMRAELLVLDELGAQKPSAWVNDILYLIVNARYTGRRPTLFTTNYRLEPRPKPHDGTADFAVLSSRVAPMLVSRLYEMAQPVILSAVKDYRQTNQLHAASMMED